MNSSMIGINKPSSELPIKTQSSQKSTTYAEGFENLLKQKLSTSSSEANEPKIEVRKNASIKDLQSRRMSKPEINSKVSNEPKAQMSEVDQKNSLEMNDNNKIESNQVVKQDSVNAKDGADQVPNEVATDVVADENLESVTNQLMPLLDLLNLIAETLNLPANGGYSPGTESRESLKAVVEQLKVALSELSQVAELLPQSTKALALKDLNELNQKLQTMLGDMIQTSPSEIVDPKAFSDLISKLAQSQDQLKQFASQAQPVKTEPSAGTETTQSDLPLNNVKAPNGDSKTEDKNAKGDQSFGGKDKNLVHVHDKVEKQSNHTTQALNGNEFQAKMESAAIAFNAKSETLTPNKMSLQSLIMDQLTNVSKMQVRTTEAGTIMSMKLNPEVLGNVEIKLEIVKNVLQAEINVENMIVKGALESNLSDLKNALSDKGYQVDQINVSVGDKQSDNQGKQQEQRQQTPKWQLDELDENEIRQIRIKDLTEATLSYLG